MKPKTIGKRSLDLAMTLLLSAADGPADHRGDRPRMAGGGDVCPLGGPPCPERLVAPAAVPGRYTPFRVCQLVVNLLLLLAMVGTMVSGVVLSQTVFAFLPISGGRSWAQPAAHPGLVLGAGFDGPPSGTPLGGPSWARFGGRPLCRRAPAAWWVWRLLAWRWRGMGVCVLVPPASSVPVRPGPLCVFFLTRPSRRWGSSWTIWPSWGCSSGWPTTAERGRRPLARRKRPPE